MDSRNFGNFVASGIFLTILVLLVFGLLQWLAVPAGALIDWIVGIASFWWLLVIVTLPWNIHFRAREVLLEGEQSTVKGIAVDEGEMRYVRRVSQRSLWVAIALHVISAGGLYLLAYAEISAVGYVSSGAALLLTALRPTVRAYEYVARRLGVISKTLKYPREDVVELKNRLKAVEEQVKEIETQLNPKEATSWAATQERSLAETQKGLSRLRVALQELRESNQAEHQRLSRESEQAMARLSEDAQFLTHVREIIRFVKEA